MHILKPLPGTLQKTGHLLADSIALWPMNSRGSRIFDLSGRGHTGVLQAGTSWTPGTSGRHGPAVDFNGINGHVVVPDHDDFTPILTPFTINSWVFMRDATSFRIASKGVYNIDGEWVFGVSAAADELYVYFMDESEDDCRIGRYGSALTGYENQWIHLGFTFDGGNQSSGFGLYFNGVRVDDRDLESNPGSFVAVENLPGPVWIGRYSMSYANGLIENVIIWRRELSAYEMALLYIEQSCMFRENIIPESQVA